MDISTYTRLGEWSTKREAYGVFRFNIRFQQWHLAELYSPPLHSIQTTLLTERAA
jgi:hypothetical protein